MSNHLLLICVQIYPFQCMAGDFSELEGKQIKCIAMLIAVSELCQPHILIFKTMF